MSDRDFYNLREMYRKLQRRVDYLEKQLEEEKKSRPPSETGEQRNVA